MQLSLQNRHALVGGGSQGIGKATAIELALLGADVTLVSRTEADLVRAMADLDTSQGQRHGFLAVDFSDTDALARAVAALVAVRPVHILVNNTGGPPPGPAHLADPDDFSKAFALHLLSGQTLVRAVVPGMREAGFGRIVNVISTSVKQPLDNLGVSNTIRGAVANWAKTLSNELAVHGITVNNVLPGATKTGRLDQIIRNHSEKKRLSEEEVIAEMEREVPARRLGEPHEIGAAVAFLCSPAAAYINGVNLPVDGGRTKCL
jgi:3-oxoacyl-[acyl-carrier protein] reductase